MPRKGSEHVDQRLIRALAHPLRVRILDLLQTETLSPKLMAQQLGVSLGDASYHTGVLRDCGCLELVRKEPRRGVTEHFYRARPRSYIGNQDLRRVPRPVRGAISWAALWTFFGRVVAAINAGTLDDREDTTFTWMAVTVDSLGWSEIGNLLSAMVSQFGEIHAESVLRLAGTDDEGVRIIVGLAGFEAAEGRAT